MRFMIRTVIHEGIDYYNVRDTVLDLTLLTTNYKEVAQARIDELNAQKGWLMDTEYVVEDTELDKMLALVAEAAYPHVIAAYQEAVEEWTNSPDWEVLDEDFDTYLYVYGDGNWIIERPDYLQDHRNIVSCALVGPYVNVDTLRYELEGGTF